MNIIQAMALAGLVASITRIQLSKESRSDKSTRELINLLFFGFTWWSGHQCEVAGVLMPWML